ncbi:hypothetical protein SteCoe_2750 [Stentor coeruleus]|uniref:Importin subunit alpha n=1 Tax=Stentor coeruleus TaxID=5963 RepID=A0A1R2CYP9_9CILI|nr:hypothetical protein SteCoe_2750 [Stentor coeruleus]
MNFTSDLVEERNKSFFKHLDVDELKKRREESMVELRKKKRFEAIVKRSRISADTQNLFNLESSDIEPILLRAEPQLGNPNLKSQQKLELLINLVVFCNDSLILKPAIVLLCKLSSLDNKKLLEIISRFDLFQKLSVLLKSEDPVTKFNISWIITNLTAASTDNSIKLASLGIIESLAEIAKQEDKIEHEQQALWSLSNIAEESAELRDRVYATNITSHITRKLFTSQRMDLNILDTMVWLLSNIFKYKPIPGGMGLIRDFMKLLGNLLPLSHEEILNDTLRGLSNITKQGEYLQEVFNTGFVPRIINLLQHDSIKVISSSLDVICNLSAGDDVYSKLLLDSKIAENLIPFMTSEKPYIKRHSLFILSNIVSCTSAIQTVTSHPIFKLAMNNLIESDREIRIEALYVLANATKYTMNPLIFIDQDVFCKLLELLNYSDPEGIHLVLCVLMRIFKCARENNAMDVVMKFEELGGVEQLRRLEAHPNVDIYNKILEINGELYGLDVPQNSLTGGFLPK